MTSKQDMAVCEYGADQHNPPLAASTGPVASLRVVPLTDAILTRYVTVESRLNISWLSVLTDTTVPIVSPTPAK